MRTFLSLNPDADSAMAIEKWCSLCWPGISRKIPVQNYHVTVAFLGDVKQPQLQSLQDSLDQLDCSAFDLTFDDVRYLPDQTLLWLGVSQVPEVTHDLVEKCKRKANLAGIRVSTRRYQPHLTLARKLTSPPCAPLIEPEFSLSFTSLQLMQSIRERSGARYVELNSWKLMY